MEIEINESTQTGMSMLSNRLTSFNIEHELFRVFYLLWKRD